MSTAVSSKDHYVAEYTGIAPMLPGSHNAKVQQLRADAMSRFKDSGFPTTREEAWKYTRLTAFENRSFCLPPPEENAFTPEMIDALLPIAGNRLVFVDGRFMPQLSTAESQLGGIAFSTLAQALEQEDDLLLDAWQQTVHSNGDGFTALNIAYATDGVCLCVKKASLVTDPVHLVFVNSGMQDSAAHIFNLLVMEEGAELNLTESYFALGENHYFTNTHTLIRLGGNARLDHYKLQQEGANATHIARLEVEQQRHSRLGCHLFSVGGRLVRHDICNRFIEAQGESLINGLFLGDGHQHQDFHTRTEHRHPQCTSREYFRGILDEHSRGVFNGQVMVHPGAQKTDARMASNNLLLSPHAEMDTKPQLEIYADDVKCTHGATVGQLDEDALFYLRSRGLDSATARGLVTFAFANEILDRIPLESMRLYLRDLLISHMPGSGYIQEIV